MTGRTIDQVETLDDALQRLRANAQDLRRSGVKALYLFGSAARDELANDSDIDIFIDCDDSSVFTLLTLLQLQNRLRDRLGREVDLMTRSSLHPDLRSDIEVSSIRVF